MPVYLWSQTAASNATADPTINFAEGQAPSSINDSARALMAAAAKYRDDTAGGNMGTAGTSTAYTVSSNQVFDSTAHMAAQEFTIYFHATNGAGPTLNVDGLGAFPIVMDGAGTVVPSGTLIAGTPYELTYVGSSSHFRLKNFYQLPFTVPIGAMIDYFGTTAPNSSYVLPFGQAISRATYSALFALFSTTYGTGDGSTTFNVPDLRGRVIAGKDDMGGSAASRVTSTYFGTSAAALGATGGGQSHTLTSAEIPSHTHSASVTDPGHFHTVNVGSSGGAPDRVTQGAFSGTVIGTGTGPILPATTGITVSVGNNSGGDGAHTTMQPTIIANKLLRII